MIGASQTPTRAAVLALREERKVVGEAYEFLDEKRLVLAAELLRQLERYARLRAELAALADTAGSRLLAALQRHGLQELAVYPARPPGQRQLQLQTRNFMGVRLIETVLDTPAPPVPTTPACFPSVEAEDCRQAFEKLVERSGQLAGVAGNLYRLMAEYRLTERRARALENIILPEIGQLLKEMTVHLEEIDLEDAIRVRRQVKTR
jgi:V/A-type H+-transporting ATPase subunit D